MTSRAVTTLAGIALFALPVAGAAVPPAAAAPVAFHAAQTEPAGTAAGSAHLVPVVWGRGGGFRGGFARPFDRDDRFFRGRFFDRDDRFFGRRAFFDRDDRFFRGRFFHRPFFAARPFAFRRPFFFPRPFVSGRFGDFRFRVFP